MEIIKGNPTELRPAEGMMLTQVGDVNLAARIITNVVYLASTDIPENWRDIPQTEADEILSAQQVAMEHRWKEVDGAC